ncbi:MAG: hypothetical protein U0807_18645 [Candidatus Binatia bacterium]
MNRLAHLAIAIALTTAAAAPVRAAAAGDFFPLAVGNWWKYRWTAGEKTEEFTVTVQRTETAGNGTVLFVLETQSSSPMVQWYAKQDGWVEMWRTAYPKKNMSGEFKPAKRSIQNPLTAGARWEWKGEGLKGGPTEEANIVVGPEAVKVPSGSYDAMRVEVASILGSSTVKKTHWFADGVGLVRSKTDTGKAESALELVEFNVGAAH